jgi:hypothetical protein
MQVEYSAMTEEQLRQEQDAIDTIEENSQESVEAEEIEELDPSLEEEHAEVERALEDRTLGIEDRI